MFSLRSFIMMGLLDAVVKMNNYQVVLNAVGWQEKGVLVDADLAMLYAKIAARESQEIPFETTDLIDG